VIDTGPAPSGAEPGTFADLLTQTSARTALAEGSQDNRPETGGDQDAPMLGADCELTGDEQAAAGPVVVADVMTLATEAAVEVVSGVTPIAAPEPIVAAEVNAALLQPIATPVQADVATATAATVIDPAQPAAPSLAVTDARAQAVAVAAALSTQDDSAAAAIRPAAPQTLSAAPVLAAVGTLEAPGAALPQSQSSTPLPAVAAAPTEALADVGGGSTSSQAGGQQPTLRQPLPVAQPVAQTLASEASVTPMSAAPGDVVAPQAAAAPDPDPASAPAPALAASAALPNAAAASPAGTAAQSPITHAIPVPAGHVHVDPAQPLPNIALSHVGTTATVEKIHDLVRIAGLRDGTARATLHLKPAELGAVQVHLRTTADGLIASIHAHDAAALIALKHAGAELQQSLQDRGINLARIELQLSSENGSAARDRRDTARAFADGRGSGGGRGHRDLTGGDAIELAVTQPDPVPTTHVLADGSLVDVQA
jgi:flagellar hook-length control protein FliK